MWIGVGIVLRLVWAVAFPASQSSDMEMYVALAEGLIERGEYGVAGSRAYWPPGLPFFLSATFRLGGMSRATIFAGNMLLFAAMVFAVFWLASKVAGAVAARFAVAVVAVWPNLVFNSGLAAKELLIAALLPLTLGLYVSAAQAQVQSRRVMFALLAGATLGATVLAQPSFVLFPLVFVVYEVIRSPRLATTVTRLSFLVLGVVVVVSPWTYRNYVVLSSIVPVTNTSGVSLYVGNNPTATGGYVPAADALIAEHGEVAANKLAMNLAVTWIREHPGQFVALMLPKQVMFLGDDSTGAFWTLRRGLSVPDWQYAIFKLISNGFWLALVVALLASTRSLHRRVSTTRPELVLLMLSFLYFFSLHSVFESGSRHHVGTAASLAILAAVPLGRAARDPESA